MAGGLQSLTALPSAPPPAPTQWCQPAAVAPPETLGKTGRPLLQMTPTRSEIVGRRGCPTCRRAHCARRARRRRHVRLPVPARRHGHGPGHGLGLGLDPGCRWFGRPLAGCPLADVLEQAAGTQNRTDAHRQTDRQTDTVSTRSTPTRRPKKRKQHEHESSAPPLPFRRPCRRWPHRPTQTSAAVGRTAHASQPAPGRFRPG